MRTIPVATAMRTATASILLASLLLCSTALAVTSQWTGTYLRAEDNVPIFYDGDTGQWNIVASAIPAPECITFSEHYKRCGQCAYLPSDEGWRSNVTQFRWGRCVNADLTDPNWMQFRGDVRMEDGFGVHDVRGQVEFVDEIPGGETILRVDQITLPLCRSALLPLAGQTVTFSLCPGLAWQTPFPASWPAGTDKVCLRYELWYVEGGNQYAEYTARPCRTIAS